MYNLPKAGRRNAAATKKVAAFFLLFFISNITLFSEKKPFVLSGELFFFDENYNVEKFSGKNDSRFVQRGITEAPKKGNSLVWDQKNELILHLDENQKILSKTELKGNTAYINKKYVLTQFNNFEENKGFPYCLYKIGSSKFSSKISLKKIWSGNLDCFISDCVFLDDGICIGGGTQDNLKHNVYVITSNDVHKCFSMPKNGDFIRLVKSSATENKIFVFLSEREKKNSAGVIYPVLISEYVTLENCKKIDLESDSKLPKDFQCFFGYGFNYLNSLILPASIDGKISFIQYGEEKEQIEKIINEAVGCILPLGENSKGYNYLARDPLIADSYFGLGLFNGNECLKVCDFR